MPTAAERGIRLTVEELKRGNALLGAANDMDKLAAETDKTANKFKLFTEDTKRVNAEIEKSTAKIKDLRQQIARTGDTTLFGDLRKEEARLRNFERLTASLRKDAEQAGVVLGATVTDSFGKQLSSAFSGAEGTPGLGPALIVGIGAALAASAVPLGAMISGAVVGAVGTGGIVGGVFAASHDPQVKAAFADLAAQAKAEFFGAGKSFVQPTIESIGILEKALANIDLGKTFALAAPDLKVIAQGLADLVTNTMPGLNKLLERSGPFADKAAKGFAYLGNSLSEFLDNVSASPGAVEGLEFLFATLGGTIKALGATLKFLSDRFHELTMVSATTFTLFDRGLSMIGVHSDSIHRLAEGLQKVSGANLTAGSAVAALGGAVQHTTSAVDDQTAALQRQNEELQNTIDILDNAINGMLGLDNAQLSVSKGWKDLSDAVAENGKHWNDNTDAAFRNRDAIQQQIANLERQREAEIKTGTSVADANKEFSNGIDKVLGYAGALGATKAELDRIRGTYEINLIVTGLASAISNVISGISFGGKRAAGGPVAPGKAYTVGEKGMETFVPNTPGTIVPNGAGQPVVLQIAPASTAGSGLDQLFWTWFAKHVQVTGGGNVQLAIMGG